MKKRIRIAAMLASALMLCGSAVPTALAADTSSAETSFSDLYEFGAVDEIAFRDMQKLDDKGMMSRFMAGSLSKQWMLPADAPYQIYTKHIDENREQKILNDNGTFETRINHVLYDATYLVTSRPDHLRYILRKESDMEKADAIVAPILKKYSDTAHAEFLGDGLTFEIYMPEQAGSEQVADEIMSALNNAGLISAFYSWGETANYMALENGYLTAYNPDSGIWASQEYDWDAIEAWVKAEHPECKFVKTINADSELAQKLNLAYDSRLKRGDITDLSLKGDNTIYAVMPPDGTTFTEHFALAVELYEKFGLYGNICLTSKEDGGGSTVGRNALGDAVTSTGDVNCDKIVDVSDAVLLARLIAEDSTVSISEDGLKNADANADGSISSDDTIMILKYIAKMIPDFEPAAVDSSFKTVNLMNSIQSGKPDEKDIDAAFVNSQYAFAVDLLKQSNKENKGNKNLLISPLSVSTALSMTANGAKDQTLAEMEKVLGGDLKIADINAYYAKLLHSLPNSESANLYPANSIWYKNDSTVNVPADFLQTNANYYGADAYLADFSQDTVTDINDWVNDKTHQMIPELLDQIPNDNVFMYLINALAFEAEWSTPYTDWKGNSIEFHTSDNETADAEWMSGDVYSYLEDEYATGFIKKYKGDGYSFAAILPKEEKSVTIGDYLGMMTPESLQTLLNNPKNSEVKTYMPKFSFSFDTELSNVLTAIGMPTAFSSDADFTGLNDPDGGYISRVLHKTFIQVDNLGTKAGAVTAVEMTKRSAAVNPIEVRLDHPFIFVILDNQNNIPVFIGYVMNPTAE